MIQIDVKSRKSIYEQVVDNFKELIVGMVLSPDEKLPSVRELSRTLTVNPNTIQKAYRELEHQGYIYTVSGRGSFVKRRDEMEFHNNDIQRVEEELKTAVRNLLFMGVPIEEIRKHIDEVYQEGGCEE